MTSSNLNDEDEFKTGDLVWLEKRNYHLADQETGVVLETHCEYTDSDGQQNNDGILVKLQISNRRETFPPSCVKRFVISSPTPSSSRNKRRTLRRARVTPSPVIMALPHPNAAEKSSFDGKVQKKKRGRESDSEESDTAATGASSQKKLVSGKRIREPDLQKKKARLSPKKSKYFAASSLTTGDEDSLSSSPDFLDFRAQRAPSSASKCKECKKSIRKHSIRLQPTSVKRGWYHAKCLKISFGASKIQPVEQMKGFGELSTKEQEALRKGLASTGIFDDDDDDDPPLASLRRKPSAAIVPARPMIVASDTDSDDDKDMPYRVEYAATGRATCKGCDERIQKNVLRIANRPLFRGKPGFTVYRHLHCTVFEEEIVKIQDVGGWRRISVEDRTTLRARIEESKVEIKKEQEELRPDELVQKVFEGETRQSPPGLSGILLPFQVEGTSWMYHQEVAVPDIRGGIMADEMGMGKTLQTIVTILDNRPKLQHVKAGTKHPPAAPDLDARKREDGLWQESLKSWNHEMEMCNVPKKLLRNTKRGGAPMGARAGTMVVCPVIALYQWQEEIKKFTEGTALSVGIYHGPNRAAQNPREVLCKYDVVLTTYQVLEADFRKMVSPNKVKCPNCGGSYKIDKLRIHLKYFCGETAQRTEAQARQRRTSDHHHGNRNGPTSGGGDRGGGGKRNKKKKCSKRKANTVAKKKARTKKSVHVKRSADYDSDSDLSVPDNLDVTSPRPSRAAAKTASKRLSASAKQWGTTDKEATSDDSDDVSDGFVSTSGDESDDETPVPQTNAKKSKIVAMSSDSESEDSSEDEAALAKARKKQEMALQRANANKMKGKKLQKRKNASKGKGGKQLANKRKGKKKFEGSSDDSSDDTSSGSEDEVERDPLEGIDLEALMEEAMAGSRASVLHTMCWWRVVLDEAHFIKSRSSQTAAAAFALTSIHRWCLSGTPLQNRVGELYSLIRFLRIDPMAHYFCRKQGCGCKSIHYRMQNGRCQDCGCSSIQHFSHFNKYVLNPIQRAGYQGDGRRAMMKLKTEVLDKSLIRRTKETKSEDMKLPPRIVEIKPIRLHPREEDFYSSLYTETKNSFDDYIQEGTLLNNYAHIFDLLTKMRQAVDHPYLIVYSKKNAGRLQQQNSPAVANGSIDCDICGEPPTDRVVSSCCGGAFCRSCVIDYMSSSLENARHDSTRCPSCREPFTIDLSQATSDVVDDGVLTISETQGTGSPTEAMPSLREMTHVSSGSILRRINLAEYATSTKIEALVQELVQMRQERPGSKALVFSQFVNMLDLIRWRLHSDPCLHDLGLGVRIIHGGMNVQSRDACLKDFREDNSVRVLLMSLKAGGVALNLTVANEVYLMDPWWNPAAEMQAIDRTHRLGQYRPIRAIRFIAEGTVEERVLQLQEKKRLVFDGTVGRDAASLKSLSVDDMKALFT